VYKAPFIAVNLSEFAINRAVISLADALGLIDLINEAKLETWGAE